MKYLFSQRLCSTALEEKAAREANTLMMSRKLFKAASCIMQKNVQDNNKTQPENVFFPYTVC